MNYFDTIKKEEIIDRIINVAEQIKTENEQEKINEDKVTKLMFEQMLRGLYLQL